jgi:hypothetical protein
MDIADGQPEVIDDLPVVVDIPSELPPEGM